MKRRRHSIAAMAAAMSGLCSAHGVLARDLPQVPDPTGEVLAATDLVRLGDGRFCAIATLYGRPDAKPDAIVIHLDDIENPESSGLVIEVGLLASRESDPVLIGSFVPLPADEPGMFLLDPTPVWSVLHDRASVNPELVFRVRSIHGTLPSSLRFTLRAFWR